MSRLDEIFKDGTEPIILKVKVLTLFYEIYGDAVEEVLKSEKLKASDLAEALSKRLKEL